METGDLWLAAITAISGIALLAGLVDRRATRTGKKRAAWYCVGLSIYLLYVNNIDNSYESSQIRFWATLLMFVCSYPTWRYLLRSEKGIPFMPLLGAIYAIYFAVPVFYVGQLYLPFRGLPEVSHIAALQLTTIGLTVMIATYYLLPRSVWGAFLARMPEVSWSDEKARKAALCIGIAGVVASTIARIQTEQIELNSILLLFSQLSLVSLALFYLLYLKKKLPINYTLFFLFILLPVQVLNDISGGLIFPIFRDSMVLGSLFLMVKKRIPWGIIAFVAIVSVPILAVKQDFRRQNDATDFGLISKGQAYLDLIINDFSLDSDYINKSTQGVVNRLDNRALFAYVVSETPSEVPYWGGETYKGVLWRFVPRFVFPNKPIEETGNTFGHRYNLLDPSDHSTSENMPLIVEMYANFGTCGVLIGMFILAVLYRIIGYIAESDREGDWSTIVALIVYSALIQVDSSFTIVFGNTIYYIVAFFVLGYFIFGVRGSAVPRSPVYKTTG